MKKSTFLLIMLFVATFSYSQTVIIDEDFASNSIPINWAQNNVGNGSHTWTFGSSDLPGVGNAGDFTSNAAVFNDDAAGDTGNHDFVWLFSPSVNIASYSQVSLTYDYAIQVTGSNEALHVGIWDNTNTVWIILRTYNVDTNPTTDAIDITAALNANPGVDASNLFIGFGYDDNTSYGWAAGIDNVLLLGYSSVPANDDCANAEVITGGATILASNINANDLEGGVTPCSGGGGDGSCTVGGEGGISNQEGVWYVYTSTSTETITVSTDNSGTDFDTEIQVKTSCGSASTCVGADDDGGANFSSTFCWLSTGSVANPVDYYMYIDGHNGALGNFELTLTTDQSTVTAPANDACIDAVNITNNLPYAITLNVDGTTNNNGFITPTGCGQGMNDGVWYTFTAVGDGEVNMLSIAAEFDLEIGVYTGSCGNFTCVANEDSSFSGESESLSFNVTVGTQYWINLGYFSFATDIAESGTLGMFMSYTPTDNDTCEAGQDAGAVNLPVQTNTASFAVSTPYAGTVLGATDSGVAAVSCEGATGNPNDDVWFKFTATTEDVHITVEENFDSVIDLYSGSCGSLSQIACADNFNNSPVQIDASGLTVGDEYIVRVFSFGGIITAGNNAAFNISVWTEDAVVSVGENNIEGLTLFPNPITDLLYINAQEEITKLSVYNQIGQLVKTLQPNQTNANIDLSNLSSGIYLVKIEAGNKISSKKIIKK